MNKKITVLAIILLVVSVGLLSGCTNKSETSGDTDKVELVFYDVYTQASKDYPATSDANWETLSEGFKDEVIPELVPFYEEGYHYGRYLVSGKVKNIAGEYLDKLNVIIIFYDSANNELYRDGDSISGLANSYTETFEGVFRQYRDYFENVHHVSFEFEVS